MRPGRLLPPLLHPDPAHLHLTGTGLTHLGSASTRAAMHAKAPQDETDSMKMFRMGVEGGKPANGQPGVQPEWFYKGTGHALVAPGARWPRPPSRWTAARSRRSPASTSSARTARRSGSASRWPTNSPTT